MVRNTLIPALQASLQETPENIPEQETFLNEIAEVITVWPKLPEHIKEAIQALIKTAVKP